MAERSIEALCETGQQRLIETRYLEAEEELVRAERQALAGRDWEALSRLYLPLQEARRQRRQRCGEGVVRLDLLAEGPGDLPDASHVIEQYPHGQLLVAGWGSVEPAARVRELAAERGLYVETFLAAVYPIGAARAAVIVPLEDTPLPPAEPQPLDRLRAQLPPHCLVLTEDELPRGPRNRTYETYGEVMAMWERLHAPFLAAADAQTDLVRKIESYRTTIRVDYACELAHQKLSAAARELARREIGTR